MSELTNCLTAVYELHRTVDNTAVYDFIVECSKASTKTWNRANYLFKDYVSHNEGKIPGYLTIRKIMTDDYDDTIYGNQDILTVSLAKEQVRMLGKSWVSYKGLLSLKKKGKYNKPVRQPHFRSHNALSVIYITQQSIVRSSARTGYFSFSNCPGNICRLPVSYERMKYARIVPKPGYFKIEMIYTAPVESMSNSSRNPVYAGIDLGIDNLAVVSIDKQGVRPLIIDGKAIKSWNIFYNSVIADKKSRLTKHWVPSNDADDVSILKDIRTSRAIEVEWDKRSKTIMGYLHWASRQIVDYCKFFGVTDIVIGHNKEWKQNLKKSKKLSRRVRRHFASIPFNTLISQIEYKANRKGIRVKVVEESYTSKTCVLLGEIPEKHESYGAVRVHRGLLEVKQSGLTINADVNGACQIVRKCKPNSFNVKDEGVMVWAGLLMPKRIRFKKRCVPSVFLVGSTGSARCKTLNLRSVQNGTY
jgi:putative transposase